MIFANYRILKYPVTGLNSFRWSVHSQGLKVFLLVAGFYFCVMNEGWIKLYRKFDEWEWFNISEMVHLFIYLLLNANHEDGQWRGVKIKRGQILTGLHKLNEKTKISIRTLRTCLDRLHKTGEIDIQTTNKYSIITILNYESYQGNRQTTDKHPDKQPTSNRQATDNKQEGEECNNEINILFDVFWDMYKRKQGSKKDCKKKWDKLSDDERQKIINTLPSFFASIRDEQFIPYPGTYLNQGRWNDEIPIKSSSFIVR